MASPRKLRTRPPKNTAPPDSDDDGDSRRRKRKSAVTSGKKGQKSSSSSSQSEKKQKSTDTTATTRAKRVVIKHPDCKFVGEPIALDDAKIRWPHRYTPPKTMETDSLPAGKSKSKKKAEEDDEVMLAKCHYMQADVEGVIYNLNDCAHVQGNEGEDDYICRIVELFETNDDEACFTAQWFYRAKDTVIKHLAEELRMDKRRVFISEIKNDNPLNCLVSKLTIAKVDPNVNLVAKEASIPDCHFYYDMSYNLPYTTFSSIPSENTGAASDPLSTISTVVDSEDVVNSDSGDYVASISSSGKAEMSLLDLYSGCGGMSTGLCLGAVASGVNLITRWAVDNNKYACKSMELNHPETKVRNENASNFLMLLKEWKKLCTKYSLLGTKPSRAHMPLSEDVEEAVDNTDVHPEEFEVQKLVDICYGDPNKTKKVGIYFKVRWKGYDSSEDTWEPMEGLSECQESIQEFVTHLYHSNALPLPGDVDVICGGPPCQGISGFNRFRDKEQPLNDPKNEQMALFMDIVDYLKPRYVLMENVVDLLKFSNGYLARFALGRIIKMNYQARLGMMTAGCYGLPQFRMRVFLWGALPNEKLPQYPLPTHDVVVRGNIPSEWERNTVAYDEDQPRELEKCLFLADAISDLPIVTNDESRDEMPYQEAIKTDFQAYIRSSKHEFLGSMDSDLESSEQKMLFDHFPLRLNADDYQRVCRVPKTKGANFRDLPGVLVDQDNKVFLDPLMDRELLPSGKPLVPDYALTFNEGKSSKPFGRLWWDETVPTVVTRAEPHNQVIVHPEQDRVLTIRENARLQGFPDYYKLCGPPKERYTQIGNAVAVPVGKVLGYSLGKAVQRISGDEPLMILPAKFHFSLATTSSVAINEDAANSS